MGLKVFVLLSVLLFALSLAAVTADTSKDDKKFDAVKEVNAETEGLEPQRHGHGGCKHGHGCPAEEAEQLQPEMRHGGMCSYGCCGKYVHGKCTHCCPRKQTEDPVEEQKRGRGGCRHGCCGSYAYGQCSYCCPSAKAAAEAEEKKAAQPQKHGRDGCRKGCCGSYAYGQCSYCCP